MAQILKQNRDLIEENIRLKNHREEHMYDFLRGWIECLQRVAKVRPQDLEVSYFIQRRKDLSKKINEETSKEERLQFIDEIEDIDTFIGKYIANNFYS
jgi:hypothetical protein